MILDHLRRIPDPEDRPFLEEAWLKRMIEETRRRAIGVRDGGEFRPKTSSIAAPVMVDDRVEAVVSMIWIRTALSLDEAISAHSDALLGIARAIARTISAQPNGAAP